MWVFRKYSTHCEKLSPPSPLQLPEGSNQLRQMQLRELAMLNGTLREDGVVSSLLNLIDQVFHLILQGEGCEAPQGEDARQRGDQLRGFFCNVSKVIRWSGGGSTRVALVLQLITCVAHKRETRYIWAKSENSANEFWDTPWRWRNYVYHVGGWGVIMNHYAINWTTWKF